MFLTIQLSKNLIHILLITILLLFLVACSNSTLSETNTPTVTNQTAEPTTDASNTVGAYPAIAEDNGYPAKEEVSSNYQLADPNTLTLADPIGENSVIGGVLYENKPNGIVPLNPYELILAEIIQNDKGDDLWVSYDEQSLRATTVDDGTFIFESVPAGRYGLVVNFAINQFPVLGSDGKELLFIVEQSQTINLGQLEATLP